MKQNKIPRNEYIIKPKGKTNPYKHDVVYTNLGQWKYPGQVTKIPSNQITMQGVNYPVQGIDDTGYSQMMYPGMDYTFPGQYVTEYPMARYGGGLPKAQNGRAQTPEEWGKEIRNVEHQIGNPSTWTLDSHKMLQDKLNEYKAWRENTPEGKAVIDYHNEPNEYVIPLPSHLQTVPKKPFGGIHTKTDTHMATGGWLDAYQTGGKIDMSKVKMNYFPKSNVEAQSRLDEEKAWENDYYRQQDKDYQNEVNAAVKKGIPRKQAELVIKKYKTEPQEQSTVVAHTPQSTMSKALEVATNPVLAMKNYKGHRLPDNFSSNAEEDFFSPTNVSNMGYQFLTGIGKGAYAASSGEEAVQNVKDKDYLMAGINAAFSIPAFSYAKKAANKILNPEVFNLKNVNKFKTGLSSEKQALNNFQTQHLDVPGSSNVLIKHPTGKMEGIGTAKDAAKSGAKYPYSYGKLATPVYEGKFPMSKGSAKGDWFDLNQTGYTDLPDFNKQLNSMLTTLQYGKRPLAKSVKTNPTTSKNALMESLDNSRYEEGMTNLIPNEYMKKAKIPYTGTKAFQTLHPNQYGGFYKKQGGSLDAYDEGGNNPATSPTVAAIAANAKALKEEKDFDLIANYLQEKRRVEGVRTRAAEIAANKAKSANPSTRTNLSYIKNGAYYCNTHTGECFQDAGATTPSGKKVPVIPGNLQWDSEMKKLGFDWTDTPEPGDIAREQLYKTMDYQGNRLSPGWYTSHSGVVTKGGKDLMIGNAPGGARNSYVNQPVDKMTGGRDSKDVHMRYQRYVGNLPSMQQDYNTIMKNLYSESIPSITPSYDFTAPLEERDLMPQSQLKYGGWLDDEQFRRGGQKGLKKYTSKNVFSSVNDIMLRNEKVFGPAGKKRYKPGLSYQDGGGYSIVDYLTSKGQDSSKQYRQQLAQKYGVANYDFSAEKNLELLDKLQNSKPVAVKQPVAKAPAQSYFIKPIQKENSKSTDRTGQNKNTKLLTKDELAYSQLPKEVKLQIAAAKQAQNKTPDQLIEHVPQGFMSKAWDAVSNPMTALREYTTRHYIPENLSQHPDKNLLDMPLDLVNPAFYVNAAGRLSKAAVTPKTYSDAAKTAGYLATSLAGDQSPESYKEAAMNTAGVAGDLGALLGAGSLVKNARRGARNSKFTNELTVGKGVNKTTLNDSKEFFDHFNQEAKATGKIRPLKKKELNFLNKEIKQRGILEVDRKHPLDPRALVSKALVIPEDYNWSTVLNPKNIATNLYKTVTEGSPESLYTMGHGRVAGWNQYLGIPTKNNPYRVHPESFTKDKKLLYTVPESEINKLQKANLSSNNASDMALQQTSPAQGIKELSFYKESLGNTSKEFNQKAYEKVYDDMVNTVDSKTGDFLYSNEKEIKKILGPKSKFKYDFKTHQKLVPEGDVPEWITQEGDMYRTSDWDKYIGSHGGVGWKVNKLPNSKYEKWSMEDVWDINPLSRFKNLPNKIRNFDAGNILGGKDFKVQLDYFAKPGGKNVIPMIPKAYGGQQKNSGSNWLDNMY